MTQQLTALETRYAGCRFRSRLEARWAVFFDELAIEWHYEPRGYRIPSTGQCYLPDFWLPGLGAFYEVKGATPLGTTLTKLVDFAVLLREGWRLAIAIGDIPRPDTLLNGDCMVLVSHHGFSPGCVWARCPECGEVDIVYCPARIENKCGHVHAFVSRSALRAIGGSDRAILNAYEAARSARFGTPQPSPQQRDPNHVPAAPDVAYRRAQEAREAIRASRGATKPDPTEAGA